MAAIARRDFCRAGALAACSTSATQKPSHQPNIVLILADDLGYGDVHFLNPHRGRLPTPHLDRLATEGMTFTDAHSGSAVCSPTRYRYAKRPPLGFVQVPFTSV